MLGRPPEAGSEEVGRFAPSLPFAETTAMATAVPTATVASAPPPMKNSRRRLLRVSDASASAAQSGVRPSSALVHGCWEFGFHGSHWD
ncbi:hypothetical protein Saso_44670 [Streptomyces asoensis]|uniref:Uncharacterized protein n=1 Tax=Streptomyces asoensis TaxID=249586 RepID=A0ABQ3S3Z5_9ACTN|nr:hypothetical protein GCM10010496_51260 [Streptomyces asoensis]GHI62817.1 hypothetical protein Saso_44670 [Streptomyces asoensis]